EGRTRVFERGVLTRDHTERMLGWFGAGVETSAANGKGDTAATGEGVAVHAASVCGPARLEARDLDVPGDISSAAFLLAAAALLPGSDLTVEGVGLNPTRAEIVAALRNLGARVSVEDS